MDKEITRKNFVARHPKITGLLLAVGLAYEARNMDLNIINQGLGEVFSSGNANFSALIGDRGTLIGPEASDPALRGHVEDYGADGEQNPRLPVVTFNSAHFKSGKTYYSKHPLHIVGNPMTGVTVMAAQMLVSDVACTDCNLRQVGAAPSADKPSLIINATANTSTLSTSKGTISVKENHGSNFHPNTSLTGAIAAHLPKLDRQPEGANAAVTNYFGNTVDSAQTTVEIDNSDDDDTDSVDMSSSGMRVQSNGSTVIMDSNGIQTYNSNGSSTIMDKNGIHTYSKRGSVHYGSNGATTIITHGLHRTHVQSVIINAP